MTDILDQIDASLEAVEEQLLRELNRFRGGTQTALCLLDEGIHRAIEETTTRLRDQLEHSGNAQKLELRTERHEVLEARLGVLRQLLKNDIPGSCVHQAHEEIETSRRRLEKRVAIRRKKLEVASDGSQKKPSGKLKGLFGREVSELESSRNRIRVTQLEEQELQDVEVFLDNGIYSASRELAMLANLIKRGATDRPPADQPRGKAVFLARELSSSLPPVNKVKPVTEAPVKESRSTGEDKSSIARTPEEIRRKLEERKYQGSGKASFAAKDIEPEWSSRFEKAETRKDESDKKEDDRKSGKAKFEARDLSRSPWQKN